MITTATPRARRARLLAAFALVLAAALAAIGARPASATAGVDDYPWRTDPRICGSTYGCTNDGYGHYIRQCTSFAAYRLRTENGYDLRGPISYGSASGAAAWGLKYSNITDMNPAPGSIAWWASGHVAWVQSVSGGNVTIEKYNWGYNNSYNRRTIASNSVSGYIHFRDLPTTPPTQPYSWSVAGQAAYTDSSKTVSADPATMVQGEHAWWVVTARNTGTATWYKTGSNPVRLGANQPNDRTSRYNTTGWLSAGRPAGLSENSVPPGGIGTFEFPVTVPSGFGTWIEHFNLLAEGLVWFNDPGLSFYTSVQNNGSYAWSLGAQRSYADSSKTAAVDLNIAYPNQTAWLVVVARNIGNSTWYNSGTNPVVLGTSHPNDRTSQLSTTGWLAAGGRPAGLQEASVPPGSTGTFEFPVKLPATPGTYNEYFNLLAEGFVWFNDPGMNFHIVVQNNGAYAWGLVSQRSYTDSSKSTLFNPATSSPGQSMWWVIEARNVGTSTWYNSGSNPINLGTSHPNDRLSQFSTTGWLAAGGRPARLLEASVPPGGIGTFEFPVVAPTTPGTYYEYFNPLVEGLVWMNDLGVNFYAVVS